MKQKEAFEILKMGKNVFLTGPAGSGKTYTLNQYLDYAKKQGLDVAITASTGIAATHIGGVTIHSWSGMGIKQQLSIYDIEAIADKKHIYMKIKKTDVLVIDEVSMLHRNQLDSLDALLSTIRESEEPFGGMQVIVCGDFFQLPPVTNKSETFDFSGTDFVYNSASWRKGKFISCYLSEQHRQKDDVFLDLLYAIRTNTVEKRHTKMLEKKVAESKNETSATKLYSHNINVDDVNVQELHTLNTEGHVYTMKTSGNEYLISALQKGCLAPEVLHLKVGAKVMFVKNNFDEGYVNGSLGELVRFSKQGYPVVRLQSNLKEIVVESQKWSIEEDGKVKASIEQIPLRLAWAITIHKSQGMSLDSALVDLSNTFLPGMGYVALSRVRTFDGLLLQGFNNESLLVHEEVLEKDTEFQRESNRAISYLRSMETKEIREKQEQFVTSCMLKKKKKKSLWDDFDEDVIELSEGKKRPPVKKKRGFNSNKLKGNIIQWD